AAYARKSIQELFPQATLDSAQVSLFNYPSSIIAFNKGNGQFIIKRLPTPIQLSSVNAILPIDVNADGFPDLVLGGNEYGFLPQFGRLDASLGNILLNDGKGNFTAASPQYSGLNLPGQVRDIAALPGKDRVYLLFCRNNEVPALFSYPLQPPASHPDKRKK